MRCCTRPNGARRPPRRYARQRPRPSPLSSAKPLGWRRAPRPPTTSSFITATHPCWRNRSKSSSRPPLSFLPHWSRPSRPRTALHRCRTGGGGVMQTILHILEKAGGWRPGLYLKIENAPYMELVIEAMDESGPMGLPALSVAHYGEQNGDAHARPGDVLRAWPRRWSASDPRSTGATTTSASSSGAAIIVRGNYVHFIALARAARTLRQRLGQQPALAGLRRSLHGQVHSWLVRSPWSGTSQHVSAP